MNSALRRAPRGALPTHTARQIIRDFIDRGLQPGDALADEATLAQRYGVSRGTLREALRLLAFLGAVTVKAGPGGGSRLARPGSAVVGSALGMVVQFEGATLRDVWDARVAIESSVAALAATSRLEDDLRALDACVEELRKHEEVRGPAYAHEAARWSLTMAQASHNPLLATIVPALVAMNSTILWRYPKGSRPRLTAQVAEVVAAVHERDGATASRVTSEMITKLATQVQQSEPSTMARRILWPELDAVLGDAGTD